MNSALWATAADRERIARARSAVLMVGSYDGSGNYGDVLQFAAALRMVRSLSGAPLPVAILERATLDHHAVLRERHPELFEGAAFAHFDDRGTAVDDGLVRLQDGSGSPCAALHLYGGGYLNQWWGERKIGLAAAAERLAGASLPLVGSGLQVEAQAVVPGGPVHALLSGASHLGARDIRSLEFLREGIDGGASVELGADDAIPILGAGVESGHDPGGDGDPVVTVHLNAGHWVGVAPDRVAALLRGIATAAGRRLELRPVIAYEDPRVSEAAQVEALLREHGDELRRSGVVLGEPVDALADACEHGLAGQRSARLAVSCSYHVALTALLAGIPTVLLAENGYYAQKAAGLRHLFDLEESLVGARGGEDEARAAAALLEDGPRRAALVARLRSRSTHVRDLQKRGRAEVAGSLERSLRRPLASRARSLIRRFA